MWLHPSLAHRIFAYCLLSEMTVINHLQFGEDAISEGLWRVVLSVLPELQPVPYPAAHFVPSRMAWLSSTLVFSH